uniref:Uncharacterized protein n=1 Tax=Romanomermis culicivorax TaxID=13658 RepID=A0A915IA36_ROMCU
MLCVDLFPAMFCNPVVVDRANKPKPSVQNPKKTKQQLEEEEDEQYALIDQMELRTVTYPATHREYEALGGYLSPDLSDAEPIVAQMWYGPCFVCNDPLCEPTTFHDDAGLLHLKLFPYLFDSANVWNANHVTKEISPILYYFWPNTIEEGRKLKADICQHLELLKVDEKLVKQILGNGPTPGAKHRNDQALGTLIM